MSGGSTRIAAPTGLDLPDRAGGPGGERAERGLRDVVGLRDELNLSTSAVTEHIAAIFEKLELAASGHDNRRVLAVLEYLRG
jgi:hypothetical protein